jgi:hypothetical protein
MQDALPSALGKGGTCTQQQDRCQLQRLTIASYSLLIARPAIALTSIAYMIPVVRRHVLTAGQRVPTNDFLTMSVLAQPLSSLPLAPRALASCSSHKVLMKLSARNFPGWPQNFAGAEGFLCGDSDTSVNILSFII